MSLTGTSSDEAYRQAGVDLKRAEAVVDIAKRAAASTRTAAVLGGIGGFSGAFEIPPGYRQPVLLSACDGVGTKLKLAFATGIHHTVGVDLVAMSVNDILVNGGQPLAFLDYLATDRIRPDVLEAVLQGVAEGCAQAGCALLGGETAEMPGFYTPGDYDLAGFCVGVVEKDRMLPQRERLEAGDIIIGLESAGLHSNGYSLVRKIVLEDARQPLDLHPAGWEHPLGETLLTPTRIYVQPVLQLLEQFPDAVKAMVHVTGGGFYDNIPRILPESGLSAVLHTRAWEIPPLFRALQDWGQLSDEALYHTFNCGLGYLLVVSAHQAPAVVEAFNQLQVGYRALPVGEITAGERGVRMA